MAERDRRHWVAYNDSQAGRAARSLCADVIEMAGPGAGRVAIDLGFGAGIETVALLAAGWQVHAFDSAPGTRERVGAQVAAGDEGEPPASGGAPVPLSVVEADVGGGRVLAAGGAVVPLSVVEADVGGGRVLAAGGAVVPLSVVEADVGGGQAPADGRAVVPLTVVEADFAGLAGLPAAGLVYSGYSLQYLAPGDFGRVWGLVRECLRPGGWVAVNLLGDRDEWAGTAGMTFLSGAGVRDLVAGLEVVRFDEEDEVGPAFGGSKHWHVFDVIARRPPA